MGRRKRKQQKYVPKRRLPRVFKCPRCGHKTLKPIDLRKDGPEVKMRCGFCNIEEMVAKNTLTEPVDAFGDFIDVYYREQEWERLNNKRERLEEEGQYTELAQVFAYLANIADINAKKAMEQFEETGIPKDEEAAKNWAFRRDVLKEEEKKILHDLETGELEDVDLEAVYAPEQEIVQIGESVQVEETEKPKKSVNLEEILGDVGFLEFD